MYGLRAAVEDRIEAEVDLFKEIKKHSLDTGAHANNTLPVSRQPQRGAC